MITNGLLQWWEIAALEICFIWLLSYFMLACHPDMAACFWWSFDQKFDPDNPECLPLAARPEASWLAHGLGASPCTVVDSASGTMVQHIRIW